MRRRDGERGGCAMRRVRWQKKIRMSFRERGKRENKDIFLQGKREKWEWRHGERVEENASIVGKS